MMHPRQMDLNNKMAYLIVALDCRLQAVTEVLTDKQKEEFSKLLNENPRFEEACKKLEE